MEHKIFNIGKFPMFTESMVPVAFKQEKRHVAEISCCAGVDLQVGFSQRCETLGKENCVHGIYMST